MCLCKADLPFSLRLRVEEGIRLCPSMIEDSSLGHWQCRFKTRKLHVGYSCMYACMYVRAHICMYVCIHIYIYMYINVFVYIIYIYMYVREPSCIV